MMTGPVPTYPCVESMASPHCGPCLPGKGHKVEAMRAACVELDHIANMLEMEDLYGRADEIREIAGKLRLDARVAREEQTQPGSPEITRRIGRAPQRWQPPQYGIPSASPSPGTFR